jgi:serine/threonine protein kinase
MPPEVLARKPYSGTLADVFCLGTILYTLLFAEFPFDRNERAKFKACPDENPHPLLLFPKKKVVISGPAKELLEGMLSLDPELRMTMKQVANHRLIKGRFFTL